MRSVACLKSLLVALFLLSGYFFANAQGPTVNWLQSNGSNSTDMVTATAMDPSGNAISVISFTNSITVGGKSFTTLGQTDLLLIKYDRGGNVLWSQQIGSTSSDESRSVTTDAQGNIYITGTYNGATLNYGIGTLTNSVSLRNEAFLIKFNVSGIALWARSMQGNGIDNSNRVYVNGSVVLIGGQTTSTSLTMGSVTATSSFFRPAWLAKLDEAGNTEWIKVFGSTYIDGINAISMSAGKIFISGSFSSLSISFGSITLNKIGSTATTDIFIASLDLTGNVIWARSIAGNSNEEVLDMVTNEDGILYAAGYFASSSLTINGANYTTAQTERMLLFAFDETGAIAWTKSSLNDVKSRITSLSYFPTQGILVGGIFSGSDLQFDNSMLANKGGEDGFLINLSKNGQERSAKQIGQSANERINSVSIGNCTAIFGGDYMSSILAIDNFTVTNIATGIRDAMIAKLSYSLNFSLPDTTRVCGISAILDAGPGYTSYNWKYISKTQTAKAYVSGTYVCEVFNEEGCRGIDSSYVSIVFADILNTDTSFCVPTQLTLSLDSSVLEGYNMYSTTQKMNSSWAFTLGYINDARYKMKVSGIWSPSTLGNEMMDPAYQFNTQTNLSTKKWSAPNSPLAFLFNGTELRPTADVYNPLHSYEYYYTLKNNTVNIRFDDTYLPDNSGSLNFEFKVYNNPVTIKWSTGETTFSINVKPTITTTYYAWITDGITTCVDSVTIFIKDSVAIKLPDSVASCSGNVSLEIEEGFDEYTWDNNFQGRTFITSEPGWHYAKVKSTQGCWAVDSVYINTILPVINIADTTVCLDSKLLFKVADPKTGVNYSWWNGETGLSTMYDARQTENIILFAKQENLTCSDTTTVSTSTVKASLISDKTSLCNGDHAMLTAGENAFYQWLQDGKSLSGEINQTLQVYNSGSYQNIVSNTLGCSDTSDAVIIKVFEKPAINILSGPEVFICKGKSLVLQSDATGPGNFDWQKDGISFSTTNKPVINFGGQFRLIYTNSFGCADTSNLVTASIVELPAFDVSLGDNTAICSGQSVTGNVIMNNASGYQFSWAKDGSILLNENTSSLVISTQGIYKAIVSDQFGCVNSKQFSVMVTVQPATSINPVASMSFCEGTSAIINASGGKFFEWYKDGVLISGQDQSSLKISGGGKYQVLSYNSDGCKSSLSNAVSLSTIPKPSITWNVFAACTNLPSKFELNNSTNSGPVTYTWNLGDGNYSNQTSFLHEYKNAGTYNITLEARSAACPTHAFIASRSIRVDKAERSIRYPAINAVKGANTVIEARNLGNQYTWLPSGKVTNPYSRITNFNGSEGADLVVRIETGAGCVTVDSVFVRLFERSDIIVPNAFTPNNDGKNDRLFPMAIGVKEISQFMIFDRWGKMIYKSSGINSSGWDGRSNGKSLDPGTYVWIAVGLLDSGEKITRKGSFLLLK